MACKEPEKAASQSTPSSFPADAFFRKLASRCKDIDSLLCVGLDPHASQLKENTADAALAFCLAIIEQTHPYAAAYKPNSAFFEQYGPVGITALNKVVKAIPEGIPVVLDVKRGDISTTAEAYATAAYESVGCDCVTLHPYMGKDSITPFIKDRTKGAFVLCKTSNPTSEDFQTLQVGPTMLYEVVVQKAEEWNTNGNVGLVVGATDTKAIKNVRRISPTLWILAPGVGFQGGSLEETVTEALTEEGLGLLLPVSRGISKADNYGEAAKKLRDDINSVRKSVLEQRAAKKEEDRSTLMPYQASFLTFALSQEVLRFGSFTLKSGRVSPYFFNAGLFRSGSALMQLGEAYAEAIQRSGLEFDVLFGPAYKGITLASAVAYAFYARYGRDIPFAYNRKEKKDHGEGGVLVGADMKGKKVLVVDDVITAGTAIREAITLIKAGEGITVGVSVALDRQEKGKSMGPTSAIQDVMTEFGIPVISIATLSSLISYLERQENGVTTLADMRSYREQYGVEY